MNPIDFKERNKILTKPNGMTDEECSSLFVYADDNECVSKWKFTFVERLRVLFFGSMWLRIFSGITQPPVSLSASRTIFE